MKGRLISIEGHNTGGGTVYCKYHVTLSWFGFWLALGAIVITLSGCNIEIENPGQPQSGGAVLTPAEKARINPSLPVPPTCISSATIDCREIQ